MDILTHTFPLSGKQDDLLLKRHYEGARYGYIDIAQEPASAIENLQDFVEMYTLDTHPKAMQKAHCGRRTTCCSHQGIGLL